MVFSWQDINLLFFLKSFLVLANQGIVVVTGGERIVFPFTNNFFHLLKKKLRSTTRKLMPQKTIAFGVEKFVASGHFAAKENRKTKVHTVNFANQKRIHL